MLAYQEAYGKEAIYMLPIVDREKCKGCDTCKEFCPADAVIRKDGKAYITMACIQCGCCIPECPEGAISFEEE